MSRTVPNPFFNYGTEATFPGALRRQANVSVATLLRPYPQYGDIMQTSTNIGEYRFNSLQLRLQRPFSKGFSFVASYAFNREKSQVFYDEQDQYDGILTWQDSQNPHHRVVAAGVFDIPVGRERRFGSNLPRPVDLAIGGWQLAGTYTYRSGAFLRFGAMLAPETVTQIGETGPTAFWFDTTGFTRLPAFTRRTNPWQYDDLTGPSTSNVDMMLSKRVRLPGTMTVEFRLEAYNAFNQMVWANPQVNITASDFGHTNAPAAGFLGRRLQYALRLEF
jgi:hypothetical protein